MRRNPDQDLWHDAFDRCANSLHWLARKLDPIWPGGMDYVKLNVLGCALLLFVLATSLALNLAFLFGLL